MLQFGIASIAKAISKVAVAASEEHLGRLWNNARLLCVAVHQLCKRDSWAKLQCTLHVEFCDSRDVTQHSS